MKNLTTEDTESTEMEWRDASVTLPDDEETVIIHTLDGDVWIGFVDGGIWRNVAFDEMTVLHWMPFPQPPVKAEREVAK